MTPLRQRMIEDMKVRNLAPLTQESYGHHVSMSARHFGRSPEALGPEEIRTYQVYLATERELSPQFDQRRCGRAAFPLQPGRAIFPRP